LAEPNHRLVVERKPPGHFATSSSIGKSAHVGFAKHQGEKPRSSPACNDSLGELFQSGSRRWIKEPPLSTSGAKIKRLQIRFSVLVWTRAGGGTNFNRCAGGVLGFPPSTGRINSLGKPCGGGRNRLIGCWRSLLAAKAHSPTWGKILQEGSRSAHMLEMWKPLGRSARPEAAA